MKILVVADPPLKHPVAIEKAAKIAQALNSELFLVGFAHDPVLEKPGPQNSRKRRNEILAENKARLEKLAKKYFPEPINYKVASVWDDNIDNWVAEKTKETNFDLILKTGHRSESLFHIPLDWQIIRQVNVPVMIATSSKWKAKPKILATIDVETSQPVQKKTNTRVLQLGFKLARVLGGDLHVAACKHVSQVLSDLDFVRVKRVEEKNKDKILKKTEDLLSDLKIPGATCHFRAGNVANSIHNIAQNLKVDLTVMGSVGRKKLKGFFIGGTAEELMQKIRCDILVIPPDQDT